MKKFSKLIQESKSGEDYPKHPLINQVDWDEIFKPLIDHITNNLSDKRSTNEGLFKSATKNAMDKFIDLVSNDYKDYFEYVYDDGSQESFFNAYSIDVKWHDLMDCIQPLLDKSSDVEDYPSWDGGYWYMDISGCKFENTDELIEDVLDISGKLKMFKIDYKIQIHSSNNNTFLFGKTISEEMISSGIKNLLELPRQNPNQWISGLKGISIFIYNKNTVQAVDLD